MGTRQTFVRLLGATLVGASSLAAYVGAMPEGRATSKVTPEAPGKKAPASKPSPSTGAQAAKSQPAEAPKAAPVAKAATAAADKGEKPPKPVIVAGIRCPHGVLEDPHRGFVRCLAPDEKDAKWLPPPPQRAPVVAPPRPAASAPSVAAPANAPSSASATPAPSAASNASPAASATNAPPFVPPPPLPSASAASAAAPPASAAPSAAPPKVGPPPEVEVKPPTFESGDVPRAEKTLIKLGDEIARCVAENGGLARSTGTMKVQFIVRARGRAEGVEVLSSQGVSPEAATCVRLLLKNRNVGHPTTDPVGVTVVLNFKQASR